MKNIHGFLENDISYQILILDHLYEKGFQWVSIDSLSNAVNLKPRTVLKYLDSINLCIESHYPESLMIDKNTTQFFKLSFNRHDSFFHLRLSIIEQSLTLSIWNKLFFFDELNIVKFSIDSFTSISTIKRKIQRVNRLIKSLNFRISSKENIYRLKGNEMNIRYFSASLFLEIYGDGTWPFFNIEQNKIFHLIDKISEALYIPVSYAQKNRIAFNHAVGITRFFNSNEISYDETIEWTKLKKINTHLVNRLPLNIIELLISDYQLSENEAQYEFSRLQTGQSFYNNEKIVGLAFQLHEDMASLIYKASCLFLSELERITDLCFSNQDREKVMIATLSAHYKSYIYREFKVQKNVTDGILKHYHSLHTVIESVHSKIQKDFPTVVYKDNYSIINQYMYAFSEVLPLNYFENEIFIYFDDPLDFIKEKLVKRMLNNFFGEPFKLKIFGPSDLSELSNYTVDFVLSTSYTEKIVNAFYSTPILFLKDSILNLTEVEITLSKQVLTIINQYPDNQKQRIEELRELDNIFINLIK